jgi:hypothetical protein
MLHCLIYTPNLQLCLCPELTSHADADWQQMHSTDDSDEDGDFVDDNDAFIPSLLALSQGDTSFVPDTWYPPQVQGLRTLLNRFVSTLNALSYQCITVLHAIWTSCCLYKQTCWDLCAN